MTTGAGLSRLLLGAGGCLLSSSPWLPWKHHRNLEAIFSEDVALIPGYLVRGEWLEAAYFAGRAAAVSTPVVIGVLTMALAVLPRRRWCRLVAGGVHAVALAALAAAAWLTWTINDTPRWDLPLLAGGLVLTALLGVELAVALCGREELIHVPALAVFVIVGAGVPVFLWENEDWPHAEYIALAAGAAIALVGLKWRSPGDGTRRP